MTVLNKTKTGACPLIFFMYFIKSKTLKSQGRNVKDDLVNNAFPSIFQHNNCSWGRIIIKCMICPNKKTEAVHLLSLKNMLEI